MESKENIGMNEEILNRYMIVLDALGPICKEIADKYETAAKNAKMTKMGMATFDKQIKLLMFRLHTEFADACSEFKRMSYDEAGIITYEAIFELCRQFKQLVNAICRCGVIFVPDKTEFCSFASMTHGQFDWFLNHEKEDIKNEMIALNSFLYNLQMLASEQGEKKERSALTRIKHKGVGLGVVEERPAVVMQYVDKQVVQQVSLPSPQSYLDALPRKKKC